MEPVDCCGLLENSSIWKNVIKVDVDDADPQSVLYSCFGKNHIAVATGPLLTISASNGKEFKETCDIEFDSSIEVICWGADATCLIVGDQCGNLHFVTVLGQLLFSHKVLASKYTSKYRVHKCNEFSFIESSTYLFLSKTLYNRE
jgi:hypothetical protein